MDDRWRVLGFGRVVHGCLESLALRLGYRVGAVCDELRLSERYVHELFVRDVGLAPKEWMRRERMVVARRMLVWGLDSQDIAEMLGFSCVDSFRREFRNVYEVPPLRFLKLRRPDDA